MKKEKHEKIRVSMWNTAQLIIRTDKKKEERKFSSK